MASSLVAHVLMIDDDPKDMTGFRPSQRGHEQNQGAEPDRAAMMVLHDTRFLGRPGWLARSLKDEEVSEP